ncbi:MAG TPA: 16S rRNA (guanine(966)-N(2))-methyltransferase RsmD [Buchnera sp. (in: enterobacteria)]|nr:16S rRNA (guanine(966)-N(2))-methyltransferase RsmD [Buchnera sp. (in: enterobacteria)]
MMKKKNSKKIRIIGGNLKGSILFTKKFINVKPTTNYMRETLFNWIRPKINQSNCLDCFSGTGALSIEAISQGANSVIALEKNNKNVFLAKENLKRLKIFKKIKFVICNTLIWLKKKRNINFNIAFIDPPFKKKMVEKTAFLLEKNCFLTKNSIIYIEMENNKKKIIVPKTWKLKKKKIKSNVLYLIYNKINNCSPIVD